MLDRAKITRVCLGYASQRQWVCCATGQKANGPPVDGAPQLRYVSPGNWEARCWSAKGPVVFNGPSPKAVWECVL